MTFLVMFRTHLWNDTVQRSFDRFLSKTKGGDICILADETQRQVDCPEWYKIPHTATHFEQAGLVAFPPGGVMWYNGDYPLYSGLEAYPDYDYYIMAEYDVIVNVGLDAVISQLQRTGGDAVAHSVMAARADWPWTETARDVYETVYGSINAFFIISNRAARHLYTRRLDLSQKLSAGEISRWPYCEAYIASELLDAGFQIRELAEFGSAEYFNWWPPIEEHCATSEFSHEAFLHPVLAGKDYARQSARYDVIDDVPVERAANAWADQIATLEAELEGGASALDIYLRQAKKRRPAKA